MLDSDVAAAADRGPPQSRQGLRLASRPAGQNSGTEYRPWAPFYRCRLQREAHYDGLSTFCVVAVPCQAVAVIAASCDVWTPITYDHQRPHSLQEACRLCFLAGAFIHSHDAFLVHHLPSRHSASRAAECLTGSLPTGQDPRQGSTSTSDQRPRRHLAVTDAYCTWIEQNARADIPPTQTDKLATFEAAASGRYTVGLQESCEVACCERHGPA